MLDSARHFQSPEFIIDYIDWMALHKLNVLSWHLTDDQGWRLEIRKYPRLTGVGAWRVPAGAAAQHDLDPATGKPRLYGGFYSQEDVRRIVAHAAARNVMVVPEIDLPGHSTAAIVAYPQLAVTADPPAVVPADWGVYPNLVNVEESTFGFFEDVLAEVMALFGTLHPCRRRRRGGEGPVARLGRVQARMRELNIADEASLQGYFTQRIAQYPCKRTVAPSSAGMRSSPAVCRRMPGCDVLGAVQKGDAPPPPGHDTVLSPDPELYLDHRRGSGPSEPPGRRCPHQSRGRVSLRPAARALRTTPATCWGANLWTEHVRTEQRAAYMTYPRAAALAERAWSAPAAGLLRTRKAPRGLQLARYRRLGIDYSEAAFAPVPTPGPAERHMSQDLQSCSNRLVLNLEDDARRRTGRAVFLVDVMDPCWILPGIEPGGHTTAARWASCHLISSWARMPRRSGSSHRPPPPGIAGAHRWLRGRCGRDARFRRPTRQYGCDTASHQRRHGRARPGRHALCFRFTQAHLDPLWAIDSVQVRP